MDSLHRAVVLLLTVSCVACSSEVPDSSIAAGGTGGAGGAEEPPASWSHVWGGDDEEVVSGLALDGEGSTVVAGFWWRGYEAFDFGCGDLGPSYQDAYDMFVAKLDPIGDCAWSRSFGAAPGVEIWDAVQDAAVDVHGDVVLTGVTSGMLDLGPGRSGGEIESQGIASGVVAKLSGVDGAHLWSRSFSGGSATVVGYGVAADSAGHVLVTGRLWNSASFGVSLLTPATGNDAFIAKLDGATGDVWWARTADFSFADEGHAIVVDSKDDVIVAGSGDEAHFPSGNLFVMKLAQASSSTLWQQYFTASGDSDTASISDIAVTKDDDVVLAGNFNGSLSFGSTTLTSKGNDGFVVRLDASLGWVKMAKRIGGEGSDSVGGIAVDGDESVFVTGDFTGQVPFDPPDAGALLDAGGADDADMFVAKLDAEGNHVWSESFGDESPQTGWEIELGAKGQLAIAGWFFGELELEPGNVLRCTSVDGAICQADAHWWDLFGAVLVR